MWFELPRYKILSAPRIKKQNSVSFEYIFVRRLKEKGNEMKIYLQPNESNSGNKFKTYIF